MTARVRTLLIAMVTAFAVLAHAAAQEGAAVTSAPTHLLVVDKSAGQLVGARLGASLALRHGARLIRPLIVVVCCLMALRLLLDSANPLGQWLLSLLP